MYYWWQRILSWEYPQIECKLGKVNLDAQSGFAYAICYFERSGSNKISEVDKSHYTSTNEVNGFVEIQEVNEDLQMIKGIFQFTALNEFGERIEVNNGKINVRYED